MPSPRSWVKIKKKIKMGESWLWHSRSFRQALGCSGLCDDVSGGAFERVLGCGRAVDGRRRGGGGGGGYCAVQNPHAVLGGVPELLRLADGGAHAQLPKGRAARPDYEAAELYWGREEELQRHGLGANLWGSFYEYAPQDWWLVSSILDDCKFAHTYACGCVGVSVSVPIWVWVFISRCVTLSVIIDFDHSLLRIGFLDMKKWEFCFFDCFMFVDFMGFWISIFMFHGLKKMRFSDRSA